MTLLSPLGLLVAVAVALPLLALAAGERRAARVGESLRLPPGPRRRGRFVAAGAVPLLLALACAQPALTRKDERRVRTDAAAFVVVDVSRSMQAAASPGAATRLDRARALAVRIRRGLDTVPTGLATLTDRALPLLFPSADEAVFTATARSAVASESPPPRERATVASTLGALADAAGGNLFLPSDRRRVLVLLTDGESRAFDEAAVARALRAARIELVTVHVRADGERVFRADGRPEAAYRLNPGSAATLARLAEGVDGTAVPEGAVEDAVRAVSAALGDGPTRSVGTETRVVALAPAFAVAALVLAAGLLLGPLLPRRAKPLQKADTIVAR